MAEFLVIRISAEPDDPAHWIAVDSSGTRCSPPITGPLDEAVKDAANRSIIVLVPGLEVLTTSVDIPVKGARLQAALPYALEEVVADDVDALHFAAGQRRASGRIPVSVVSRERMEEWLNRLEQAGLQATSLVADSYGLARIPGTISLLVTGDHVYANDGADLEVMFQGLSPAEALAAIGTFDQETDDSEDQEEDLPAGPARHVLVYCDPAEEERFQHDWLAIRQELDSLDVKILADGAMPRMAITVASGAGVNLLQGDYGRKTSYSGMLKPWRNAAVLLLALALLGFGGKAANYITMKRELTGLQEQFLAEYQQMVPNASLPRDPDAAVQSLISRAGSGQAPQVFLNALEQLSLAIGQNASASIDAISFRAGVVDVRLAAPDVATLDSIQRAVSESGRFSATIQSTDQDGDKVNSRIQIQGGGA